MDSYGLLGKDIGYSFSPNYFRAKFQKLGIDARYENFDCANMAAVKQQLSDTSISGYNVTIPYKEAVIPMLDELDLHAKRIGAVNTIARLDDGRLKGFNTDFIGFGNSLLEWYGHTLFKEKENFSAFAKISKPSDLSETKDKAQRTPTSRGSLPKNSSDNDTNLEQQNHTTNPSVRVNALILGTGGASKAVVYALEQLGVQCRFVSRKRTKDNLTYNDLDQSIIRATTLIVNCTPLGTFPNIELYPDIPFTYLDLRHIAYDLIYNPLESKFLANAAQQKASTHNGLRMLELQAEAAWDIWNTTS